MAPKRTKRNYSFKDSKRMPESKMTEISGVKIPSLPGTCYHAIMCSLAESKDHFVPWDRVVQRSERYMRQYGGPDAWQNFCKRSEVKPPEKRIKENTHALTRTGKNCYGLRLHERGCVIYFFHDGAMLITGGKYEDEDDGTYDVVFSDGKKLQVRHRGRTMTHREYKKFLSHGLIDASCNILNLEGIKASRSEDAIFGVEETPSRKQPLTLVSASITLSDTYDQKTAYRLQSLGFVVERASGVELFGTVPADSIDKITKDPDVIRVDVPMGASA